MNTTLDTGYDSDPREPLKYHRNVESAQVKTPQQNPRRTHTPNEQDETTQRRTN